MPSKKHVSGNKSKDLVFLYALSTCPWCKKTKTLLNDLSVTYDYIDVDLLVDGEQDEVVAEIESINPQGGFPTLVINKTEVIVGYKPEEITAILS